MDITDGNTTYTLPLDSLDHNLMSRFSRTEDRMIPLWSNIGLGKETHDKYYQIKVYAQNNNPDVPENLDELLAMQPLYKCSICNVEVPKAHKKDHVASPKHKITLKLAEKVLERTKSLILDTENDNIANVIPGTYFCESCAVSVDENQREDHELSKKHFKSILHDRFLNDLLLVYTDKENLEKLDFEYLNYTETEELNSQNELYKQMNKQNETNKQNESNKQNEPNKHSETKKQSETNKQSQTNKQNETKIQPQVPNEDTEILSVKGYLDLLMKRFKQESILSLEVVNEKIVIQVIDGTKIVVNQDNFHAYTANSDCTMCRVCMVVVDRNDGDMDESLSKKEFHKYTDMHMMRVMTALEDKHCIRQIDSIMHHCIICNANFAHRKNHEQSNTHKINFKSALKLPVRCYICEFVPTLYFEELIEDYIRDFIRKANESTVYYYSVCESCEKMLPTSLKEKLRSHNKGQEVLNTQSTEASNMTVTHPTVSENRRCSNCRRRQRKTCRHNNIDNPVVQKACN